jgi:hypothetical protein
VLHFVDISPLLFIASGLCSSYSVIALSSSICVFREVMMCRKKLPIYMHDLPNAWLCSVSMQMRPKSGAHEVRQPGKLHSPRLELALRGHSEGVQGGLAYSLCY